MVTKRLRLPQERIHRFFEYLIAALPDSRRSGLNPNIGKNPDSLKGAAVGVADAHCGEMRGDRAGQNDPGDFAVGPGGWRSHKNHVCRGFEKKRCMLRL